MNVQNRADIIKARYIASAVWPEQYPAEELTEIAFIGRSNVGKSSLINALVRQNRLARISGTPGKTQTINFYLLTIKLNSEERRDFHLVDLPGYGYARTGQANRNQWAKFIEEYIQKSRVKLVCQLLDIRHAPMASDIAMHEWLIKQGIPVRLVATKADKISRGQIRKHIEVIGKQLNYAADKILVFSSATKIGRPDLLDVIESTLLK